MDNNKGEGSQKADNNGSVTNNETGFLKAVARHTRNLRAVGGLLLVVWQIIAEIVKICRESGLLQ